MIFFYENKHLNKLAIADAMICSIDESYDHNNNMFDSWVNIYKKQPRISNISYRNHEFNAFV